MGKYSIKELERLSGIKAHTLRIWEKRYGLFEPDRTETNIRYYSDNDLKRLLNISILITNGVKISKIVSMQADEIKDAVVEIEDKEILKRKRIDDLIVPMIDFDEDEFDRLFESYAKELGIEKTFTSIIYPFLEKVGLLWLTDEINPSQEHFVSHIIRQKLLAAIDFLPSVPNDAERALLFLPEGEYHEIGLLFFAFLYKQRGVRVFYFGQSAPITQIIGASKKINPKSIITYCVIRPKGGLQNLITRLSECVSEETFFIANRLQKIESLEVPSNIQIVHSYKEIFDQVD